MDDAPCLGLFGVFPWVKYRPRNPIICRYRSNRAAEILAKDTRNRQARKDSRAENNAKGVCSECGKERKPGYLRCEDCVAYARSKAQPKHRSEGIGGAI